MFSFLLLLQIQHILAGSDTRPIFSPLQQLIIWCFDPKILQHYGPPKDDIFIVKAVEFDRMVSIEFSVNGDDDGSGCLLEMNAHDIGDLPLAGAINSLTLNDNQPVRRRDPDAITCIRIYIYAVNRGVEESPYWELTNLCPNGLVSGKFIRSFIVQGIRQHSSLMHVEIPLTLADQSNIRELYWLTKGVGQTYYEDQWNMEYDYFNCIEPEKQAAFSQMSRKADKRPASQAFADNNFNPITAAGEIFEFCYLFQLELENWRKTQDEAVINTWTIRKALDIFLPFWVSRYNETMGQILAQNTFLYFFRHHPEFEKLARQVLTNQIADFMTGNPRDPTPFDFDFTYNKASSLLKKRRTTPRHSEQSEGGSSSNEMGPSSVQATHRKKALLLSPFAHFIFIISIFLIIFVHFDKKPFFTSENNSLDAQTLISTRATHFKKVTLT